MNNKRLQVWDLPTRVFHWLLVFGFSGAYITAESERWALLHVACGYTVLGLILFRLIWGFAGSRYARFVDFVVGPAAIFRYIRSFLQTTEHPAGHNPLGAVAILLLLLLGLACAVSGVLIYQDVDIDWLEQLHELSAWLMLIIVAVHVIGVIVSSVLHRQNLIRAMIDGKKRIAPHQAISSDYPLVALLLAFALAVFWLWLFWDKDTALKEFFASVGKPFLSLVTVALPNFAG